jgi:hypothetical protein
MLRMARPLVRIISPVVARCVAVVGEIGRSVVVAVGFRTWTIGTPFVGGVVRGMAGVTGIVTENATGIATAKEKSEIESWTGSAIGNESLTGIANGILTGATAKENGI